MKNPVAFTAVPVTIVSIAVYVGLLAGLLYVHHVVPAAPKEADPIRGINITEAWRDLQELSNGYHPYNSKRNDEVRDWLLRRIDAILENNGVQYSTETLYPTYGQDTFDIAGSQSSFVGRSRITLRLTPPDETNLPEDISFNSTIEGIQIASERPPVVIYNDMTSNITFSSATGTESVYFEGTNIMVYIRGLEDDLGGKGVLVNAHYDSVSTGFGATDDGVGVVTVLQLIKYFTTPGNRPRRGVVALLNNGEEDYLNGARVFMQHPISNFPDTFLNLEGAGAGGRGILFRSTDAEVTKYYKKSPFPFGTVLSADAFSRGLIRSQTDYIVFNEALGLRGLDVAFMEPRARYHTSEDSARTTSKDSVWHMLSAALATTEGLTSDTKSKFMSGEGSDAVWFDLFGRAFALLNLQSMFAISVALLIFAPVVLIALLSILRKADKCYLFARKALSNPLHPNSPDDETVVYLGGWRGVFRYPIAFTFATAVVVHLAYLVVKVNPYIIYSSQYAVWSMLLTAWFVVCWFILRGADAVRPSALHRAHALSWLLILFWLSLVFVTIAENNFKIAGGYFMVFYFAAVWVASLISYLELFALPKKSEYLQIVSSIGDRGRPVAPLLRSGSMRWSQLLALDSNERPQSRRRRESEEQSATETTVLLSQSIRSGLNRSRKVPRPDAVIPTGEVDDYEPAGFKRPFGEEQAWSGYLPSWLWSLEFLCFVPVIILVGQVGLLLTSALHQTPADGNPVLFIYMCIAILSVLLLLPVSPFIHRVPSQIPTFLFLVFIGTLLYNLMAFPFSEQNRLKVYFVQQVDLEFGINKVSLTGLDGYVQQIIAELPSAVGQPMECSGPSLATRKGLQTCSWNGPAPDIAPLPSLQPAVETRDLIPLVNRYRSWLSLNASRINDNERSAIFSLAGRNTRACKLVFKSPISDFNIKGAAPQDDRFPKLPKHGAKEIRLWNREWEKPWEVHVKWDYETEDTAQFETGKAVCLWSDDNKPGMIPALDEIRRFMPVWSAVTKYGDGLVEGSKPFVV